MRLSVLFAAFVACTPPQAQPPKQSADASAAVSELRAARFPEAERASLAVLKQDRKNSTAAAVHAVAKYDQAIEKLVAELGTVIDQGEGLKFFDHERGRAAWQAFLDELEVIDLDLEIAAADPAFSLELCIACWKHDFNRNGRIDDRDEKFFELEFDGRGGELQDGDPRRRPTYHFDVGDIYWARAMVSFQRAAVELVLAYRWSELDKLLGRGDAGAIVIKLVDPGRVRHARELLINGLGFSERERQAYMAETDDDREWVPNPKQKSYAMPLEVDAKLYETWGAVLGDVHRMLASQEGLSLREAATALLGDREAAALPAIYVDVGAMFREPTDIVIDIDDTGHDDTKTYDHLLRGLLGHGYAQSMRASPLVARLRHMKDQVDRGEDTLERKLRYLIWMN
ncbi:MAG TPA: hypothetical protein VMZ53_02220 [Kofleriaceae bacterium]|nr:hypothetical protein [Kofleriaceae bacterium]